MPDNQLFDVFLSYSREDKSAVEELARRLEDEARLKPWLDKWNLIPAEESLRLALECDYAWAERDALFLAAAAGAILAESYQDAGNVMSATRARAASLRALAEAETLASNLILTAEDLAAADMKARAWLRHRASWMR